MSSKCPVCSKPVYFAEQVLAAGKKFHKACFKCKSCSTRLDSTTLAEHGDHVYCKNCHGKNFGPTGYGFGGGAGTLSNTGKVVTPSGVLKGSTAPVAKTKAKFSSPASSSGAKFCTNCGVGGQTGKFCSSCGTKIGASSGSAKPSETKTAPSFLKKSTVPKFGSARAKFSGGVGGGDKCGRCGKAVYHAEKAIAASKVWHKACLRCAHCGTGLQSTTLKDRQGEIYCGACYAKNYGPKGFGYGVGSGALAHTQ